MSFWDIVWFIIVSFFFVAYLMVLFSILADLFRDHRLPGWAKALWVVCLLFVPFVTALIYLIVRGRAMAERSAADLRRRQEAEADYIRRVARADSPPLADAARLHDEGLLTDAEFDRITRRFT
ncbi:PLDc N-terminal domain-containing protein [Nocardia blacklockiae]|uniref:PLDc N-terminal domain-containing protein n=1 Tax=Nocardia blacklockiae TaxID=480036 RepID=UPI001894FEE1|nr:PLDc N-terminal domain-containing protein [Nocardia blacklockiae]MBF6170587.1 PLDc N-terminal domain-containing protein [Nocardia blacklockiae]